MKGYGLRVMCVELVIAASGSHHAREIYDPYFLLLHLCSMICPVSGCDNYDSLVGYAQDGKSASNIEHIKFHATL